MFVKNDIVMANKHDKAVKNMQSLLQDYWNLWNYVKPHSQLNCQ